MINIRAARFFATNKGYYLFTTQICLKRKACFKTIILIAEYGKSDAIKLPLKTK